MFSKRVARLLLASGALFFVAAAPPTMAQDQPTAKSAKPRKHRSWKAAFHVTGDFRYDDNPFLLSDRQKTTLETAGTDEQISGRFRDMDSVSDFIFAPKMELAAEGPGIAGRKSFLRAEVGYNRYFRNERRSHVNLDLSAAQAVSKNGRARLKFEFVPSYFQKNYLADATNMTGSVLPSERVYLAGNYNEWDLTVDYRYRVAGGKTDLIGRIGYLRRRYDAPFLGRDRNAPHAGVGFAANLAPRWEIDFDYDFAASDSPRVPEVLILDEPDFGFDFNGNGNTTDLNTRTVQPVDRTFTQQQFRVSSRLGLLEKTELELSYQRRNRHFSSHERFDIAHNGRTENRDTIDLSLVSRLAHGLHFSTGYAYALQNSNRSGDLAFLGETADYRRNRFHAGLTYRF